MANAFESIGFKEWAFSGFKAATIDGVRFSGLATGIQAIYMGAATFGLGTVAEGIGMLGGSMISAIPVANQTLAGALGDKLFGNPLAVYDDPTRYVDSISNWKNMQKNSVPLYWRGF